MIRRALQILLVLIVAFVGATAFVYFRQPRPRLVGPVTYYEYAIGQAEQGNDLHIAPDTELYKAIEEWLAQKRKWRPDLNTYAP